MDFDWSDEQRALRETIIRFAERELGRAGEPGDPDGLRRAWKKCGAMGIQGLAVAEEYGGGGADALTVVTALEALGYGCPDNGLIFSLNAQMWACQHPIEQFGTEQQKRRWLPGLCDGTLIGAHAMSEPDSGSDAFALTTKATRHDTGYVLSGTKTFVTNAPAADVFVLFATTGRDRGFGGLCAFVVERDTPGLSVTKPVAKMGLTTSPMGDVVLDGVEVGADALLGRAGRGMQVFLAAMERERSLILASTIGTMERDLERSLAHARERRQFGQPIGKFQAVANRIVDMKLRLETARLLLYRLAWLIDNDRPVGLESALTKLYLSDVFVESSLDALQVHGGYGYMSEAGLEQHVRDAIGSRIYSGTTEIQRNLVARHLGL